MSTKIINATAGNTVLKQFSSTSGALSNKNLLSGMIIRIDFSNMSTPNKIGCPANMKQSLGNNIIESKPK